MDDDAPGVVVPVVAGTLAGEITGVDVDEAERYAAMRGLDQQRGFEGEAVAACRCRRQRVQETRRIDAKAALRVLDQDAGGPADPEIRDEVGDAAEARRVGAFAGARGDDQGRWLLAVRAQQARQVGGLVLAVAVQGDDGFGAVRQRMFETAQQRDGLAGVARMAQHGDAVQSFEGGGGAVLRAVVDDDHRIDVVADLGGDAPDGGRLVIGGDDRVHAHAVCSPRSGSRWAMVNWPLASSVPAWATSNS